MVTTLIAKKLIKPIGQKEVPGRPTLYGTTSEFLIHFGLNKLSDLPLPGEVKELNFENLDDLKFRDEINTPEIDEFPEDDSIENEDKIDLDSEEISESMTDLNPLVETESIHKNEKIEIILDNPQEKNGESNRDTDNTIEIISHKVEK